MQQDDTYRATLVRAAEILGGAKPLCDHLQVPMADLARWLTGDGKPPIGIFLRAVDVLIEERGKPKRSTPDRPNEKQDTKDG
ncbi:MAG TPA: hypothetical protein VNO69_09735 [Methyloceanibacter sp.]|nr:hypothetical protein [Methyloceanibacter sp.]